MKRTTKRIITISSVLVVILALLCTGVSLYINSIFDRIEKIPEVSRVDPSNEFFETDSPEESPTTAPVVKPEDIGWGEIEPFLDDKLINILLVGQDRYVGTARQRSDTMLLCSINPETKKVSMISFLRDLYVQIPGGYSDNRLNAAYAFGGFPLLVDAFYTNFGVTIDGCFEVDLAGFRSIVDILDGVDVTLTAREAEVVGVGSEEKLYHLNGKEALSYAQIRKLDSDFGRTQRQRNASLPLAQLSYTVTAFRQMTRSITQAFEKCPYSYLIWTKYVGNSKMSICRLIRIEFDSSVCTLRMNQVYMVKFHFGVWQEERCNEKG